MAYFDRRDRERDLLGIDEEEPEFDWSSARLRVAETPAGRAFGEDRAEEARRGAQGREIIERDPGLRRELGGLREALERRAGGVREASQPQPVQPRPSVPQRRPIPPYAREIDMAERAVGTERADALGRVTSRRPEALTPGSRARPAEPSPATDDDERPSFADVPRAPGRSFADVIQPPPEDADMLPRLSDLTPAPEMRGMDFRDPAQVRSAIAEGAAQEAEPAAIPDSELLVERADHAAAQRSTAAGPAIEYGRRWAQYRNERLGPPPGQQDPDVWQRYRAQSEALRQEWQRENPAPTQPVSAPADTASPVADPWAEDARVRPGPEPGTSTGPDGRPVTDREALASAMRRRKMVARRGEEEQQARRRRIARGIMAALGVATGSPTLLAGAGAIGTNRAGRAEAQRDIDELDVQERQRLQGQHAEAALQQRQATEEARLSQQRELAEARLESMAPGREARAREAEARAARATAMATVDSDTSRNYQDDVLSALRAGGDEMTGLRSQYPEDQIRRMSADDIMDSELRQLVRGRGSAQSRRAGARHRDGAGRRRGGRAGRGTPGLRPATPSVDGDAPEGAPDDLDPARIDDWQTRMLIIRRYRTAMAQYEQDPGLYGSPPTYQGIYASHLARLRGSRDERRAENRALAEAASVIGAERGAEGEEADVRRSSERHESQTRAARDLVSRARQVRNGIRGLSTARAELVVNAGIDGSWRNLPLSPEEQRLAGSIGPLVGLIVSDVSGAAFGQTEIARNASGAGLAPGQSIRARLDLLGDYIRRGSRFIQNVPGFAEYEASRSRGRRGREGERAQRAAEILRRRRAAQGGD
jgi:hypothetical protein